MMMVEGREIGSAVFAHLRFHHAAAGFMRYKLRPVADAQYRHRLKKRQVNIGRTRLVNPPTAAPKNDALYFLVNGRHMIKGVNFAIYIELAHPSGDELGVLRTEVKNQDLVSHAQK